MIKILYVVSTLKSSGPNRQLFNIISSLEQTEYMTMILSLSPETSDSLRSEFQNIGVNCSSLEMSRVKGFLGLKAKLLATIKAYGPDIIHSHGIRADVLMSSLPLTHLWVTTIHNNPKDDYLMKYGQVVGRIMAYKHLDAFRKCRNNIACSNSIRDDLKKYKIEALSIQNGVDISTLRSNANPINYEYIKPVFITVGSLIKRKNAIFILEAFREYEKYETGTLLVLGDGPEYNKLIKYNSKNVHFLGNVSNVSSYLSISTCFISASFSEGLPNTVLESLSLGVPVLLSSIPSHVEINNDFNVSSKLFPINAGHDELLKLMRQVERLFNEKSKTKAKEVAQSQFSSRAMSIKYQDIYKRIHHANSI